MLLIICPHCGERAQDEFEYFGDATVQRAKDAMQQQTQQMLNYVYIRENRRGPHLEWWQHVNGCRQWIKVKRNTLTHEIMQTARADEFISL